MPFRSEKQRRYLAANKSAVFKEWKKNLVVRLNQKRS